MLKRSRGLGSLTRRPMRDRKNNSMRTPLVLACCIVTAACGPRSDSVVDTVTISPVAPPNNACLIDSTGIGGIQLGSTLGESRTVIPGSRLERTSDGDGAALVAVKVDTIGLMTLHAGEDDSEAPVDWTKTISFAETFHSSCRTATGIHPGALVADVQGRLGAVVRIIESEIESRQYITFERQPSWMTLRLDYSGVFPAGSRETTVYKPDARLLSVSISRRN